MYRKFFHLNDKPFRLTPDTEFFFSDNSHKNALDTLSFALRSSEGFVKIVGEVGTGKTLICRKLLSSLGQGFNVVYIPNPYLSPEELRGFLAEELGADIAEELPAHKQLMEIYRALVHLARDKKQVVLVVDEAQAMPRETLESLRLLTNLETEKRKLLQVVLLGQPELDSLLAREDLRQLRQRIVFSERLKPFSADRVAAYVRHRLAKAGANRADLFTPAALYLLYLGSGGTPRLINLMAHKSMLCAYGLGHYQVTTKHVAKAIIDSEESRFMGRVLSQRWRLLWPFLGATAAFSALWLVQFSGVLA